MVLTWYEAICNGIVRVHYIKVVSRCPACRLTKDGDFRWVTAERGDVVARPFEGHSLV